MRFTLITLLLLAVCAHAQTLVFDPATPAFVGSAADHLGHDCVITDDLDGDGIRDLAVSARRGVVGGSVCGYVRVLSGVSGTLIWQFDGNMTGLYYGENIASADVDGDGVEDLVISGPGSAPGAGRVDVWSGASIRAGAPFVLDFVSDAPGVYSSMGVGLAVVDLDSDGKAEVIVGRDDTFDAQVWSWGGSALSLQLTIVGGTGNFGLFVSAANIDGIGNSEVIVGDLVGSGQGNLRFYAYPSGTMVAGPLTDMSSSSFGHMILNCGDLNGDGADDIAVSAPADEPAGSGSDRWGSVRFYSGVGLTQIGSTWYGAGPNMEFGYGLGLAGDVDGDGFGDLVVGSPALSGGASASGMVEVIRGSSIGAASPAVLMTIPSTTASNEHLGFCVASGLDVSGDGIADLVIGAETHGTGLDGGAYLYSLEYNPYPGSGLDFYLATGINTAPSSLVRVHPASFGSQLNVHFESPMGTYLGSTPALLAQIFATGNPPPSPAPFPMVHLDFYPFAANPVVAVYDGTSQGIFGPAQLPFGGMNFSYVLPYLPAGTSVMLQAFALVPTGPNGWFIASDGHELQF